MLSYKESLKILKETNALLEGHFVLSSGLHSDKYVQCAQLLSKPNKAKEICLSLPDKIKETRGKGLLTAFEMHDSAHLDGHKVSIGLLNHGVYAKETHHSTVRIAPALTISLKQIDALTEAVRAVVEEL